jgi:hypothetical protein
MTLQEAKSIARHLGLTLRKVRSGDYRVNCCLAAVLARPSNPKRPSISPTEDLGDFSVRSHKAPRTICFGAS